MALALVGVAAVSGRLSGTAITPAGRTIAAGAVLIAAGLYDD